MTLYIRAVDLAMLSFLGPSCQRTGTAGVQKEPYNMRTVQHAADNSLMAITETDVRSDKNNKKYNIIKYNSCLL